MQIYKAPLNDIKFLINDFLKISKEDPIIANKDLEVNDLELVILKLLISWQKVFLIRLRALALGEF